jgi:UDP-N-acetylmuramyl pentapeptide phosphotransferase/UDP-N-acetylglucosamine-1-phosphate transferase
MSVTVLLLICLAVGGAGASFIEHFGKVIGLLDKPNNRSSHSSLTPKGGGIGILAAFLFVSVWEGLPVLWWVPAGALAVFSLVGDRIEVAPKLRLLSQFVAAWVFLASQALPFYDPLRGTILILALSIFVVGTANFYNFMDGINGIAGITGLVGFGLLGSVAYAGGHQTAAVTLSLCMASACLGFLPFNMPRARVFMGDVGSILLGFVFAQMVLLLSRNSLDFVCYLSFLFPFYADELATMVVRVKERDNLLKAHRRHIYQLLANEGGIEHWKVAIGYGFIQLFAGISAVAIRKFGEMPTLCLLLVYAALWVCASARVRRRFERA